MGEAYGTSVGDCDGTVDGILELGDVDGRSVGV